MNSIFSNKALLLGISLFTIVSIENFTQNNISWATDHNETLELSFPDASNEKKYKKVTTFSQQNDLQEAPMGKIIQTLAEQFLGSEYKAGLLDSSTQETLFISLQQFDCLLFIETVLAIANNVVEEEYSYKSMSKEVENQRYWNGKLNGYCSRLHYFSDWIGDNERRGNIKNINLNLGASSIDKKLNFMTTHRSSYPNLAKSKANYDCIGRVESSLSEKFNYIPTNKISATYNQLKPGDLVGIATNIKGLDFTHTGFVYQHQNGKLGLIHASPIGKVVIAKDLQKYVENVNNAIGIVVSRANKPKLRSVPNKEKL